MACYSFFVLLFYLLLTIFTM